MDMDMDMGMGMNSTGMMTPWLHFTPGDTILFQNWVPIVPGAIFGTCIGLFMLAIVDRWLVALRRFMEIWWAERFVPTWPAYVAPANVSSLITVHG